LHKEGGGRGEKEKGHVTTNNAFSERETFLRGNMRGKEVQTRFVAKSATPTYDEEDLGRYTKIT